MKQPSSKNAAGEFLRPQVFAGVSRSLILGLAVLATSVFCGCAHYTVNKSIERTDQILQPKLAAPQRDDEILLVLAFSGGGTRAAALSYGVLEALSRIEIADLSDESHSHTLLKEVDIISSVSGGSFTAAYYGLYGDRIFDDFEERFLYQNINRGLLVRTVFPVNIVKLASSGFGRSDLAAQYYDKLLFNGATFQDLQTKDTPDIFIQATDIVDGIYFGFVPYYFSLICSDLNSYPVSRAVAASAAFPGPFTSISLKNFAGVCDFQPDPWMFEAVERRDTSDRAFYTASNLLSYLNTEKKAYVHLVDGGIADNLALRGPLEVILARGGLSGVLQQFGLDRTRRVVFIIVNAETRKEAPWGLKNVGPGLLGILGFASSTMISSYNYETIELLRRYIAEWSAERARAQLPPIEFYAITVAFNTLPDEEERRFFLNIGTSFNLKRTEVDRLTEVGARILYASESFQKLVNDLGGKIPSPEDAQTNRQVDSDIR